MKGNIGEALVQYLLSHFCLVHKIDGSSDVGNDFICELIKENYPTNLLFYVQVKFWKSAPTPSPTTIEYWKGSPIPVYLFWIKGDPPSSFLNGDLLNFRNSEKYYKRMTPKLHRPEKHKNEKFKKFSEKEFKRDLIVDYARTQYQRGFLPVIEPRDFPGPTVLIRSKNKLFKESLAKAKELMIKHSPKLRRKLGIDK